MSMYSVPPMASTPGIDAFMGLYNLTEDKWDDNLMWFFAIAHVLWHRTAEEIPAAWEYGHSEVDDSETWIDDTYTEWVVDLHESGQVTDDDLLTIGEWLNKIDIEFRARGENY